MSAFTLSSDCHALLCELHLQRAASTRYLQDTLYAPGAPGRALLDTLEKHGAKWDPKPAKDSDSDDKKAFKKLCGAA